MPSIIKGGMNAVKQAQIPIQQTGRAVMSLRGRFVSCRFFGANRRGAGDLGQSGFLWLSGICWWRFNVRRHYRYLHDGNANRAHALE